MPITRVPPRLQILRAISAALEEINPDNGYEFDLRPDEHDRKRVVRGRPVVGNDEPLPMVSLMEPPVSIEGISTARQPDNTKRVGDWDIVVQGWAKDDAENPTDIGYQLEFEVRNRLALEKKRPDARPGRPEGRNFFGLGDRIMNFTIGSPVVRPNEHVSEQASFYFVLTLQLAEDMASNLR